MPRCFLGLGGNIGDVRQTFAIVLSDLASLGEPLKVVQASRIYRTLPVGEDAGGEFRNAAIEVETDLSPHKLLALLQSLERAHGRNRDVRWSPRPLDIDLILYGDQIVSGSRLQIPHPACWYRRFVLDPLIEIAADVIHPVRRVTIGKLHARLLAQPFRLGLAGGNEPLQSRIANALRDQFPQIAVNEWNAEKGAQELQPTIIAWLGSEEASASTTSGWDSLPRVSRLNIPPNVDDLCEYLSDVLRSATDRPEPVGMLTVDE